MCGCRNKKNHPTSASRRLRSAAITPRQKSTPPEAKIDALNLQSKNSKDNVKRAEIEKKRREAILKRLGRG